MPSSPVLAGGRVQAGSGCAASLGSVSLDGSPRVGLDEERPAEDGWMDDGWPGWQEALVWGGAARLSPGGPAPEPLPRGPPGVCALPFPVAASPRLPARATSHRPLSGT